MRIRNTCFGVCQYSPSDDNDDLEFRLPTSANLRNPAGEQRGVGPGQSEGDIEQSGEQAAPGNSSSGQADGAPGASQNRQRSKSTRSRLGIIKSVTVAYGTNPTAPPTAPE
ncbi:hypothetical protein EMCG_06199 [[Emmonsia] crescens]|uniref:Uncharacterized protein n=1 Tax=[Emmonsia] crescens TaxID=73230 RepID=A0A0G2IBV5_9EURO|nr:hypothetical protein EMCG_06199 [Emmonsia crescens UAMH 3008]